ncbi:hypothetical protein E4U54_003391 [Claviceps lovelessii]|nr:hypothetical protein E4U54_003391 [Claviceps lovelessii]
MALAFQISACKSALGPFAVGDIADCISLYSISTFSKGSDTVQCLKRTITSACLPSLPTICTELAGESGSVLASKVPLCGQQLGPFAVGKSLDCLISGKTQGDDIISCLWETTGLIDPARICPVAFPQPTVSSTPTTLTCLSQQLPSACAILQNSNGLSLKPLVSACQLVLGSYGVDAIAQCLNPVEIVSGSQGLDIVSCLTRTLSKACLTRLPSSCEALGDMSLLSLAMKLPQCVTDLGPFANDGVKTCASSKPNSGQEVLNCITNALAGGSGSGRVSGGDSTAVASLPSAIARLDPVTDSPDPEATPGSGPNPDLIPDPSPSPTSTPPTPTPTHKKGHKHKGHRKGKGRHNKDDDSETLTHFAAGGDKSSSDFWWKFNEWVWKHNHGKEVDEDAVRKPKSTA